MKPSVEKFAPLFHFQIRMSVRSKYDNVFIFDVYCSASTWNVFKWYEETSTIETDQPKN